MIRKRDGIGRREFLRTLAVASVCAGLGVSVLAGCGGAGGSGSRGKFPAKPIDFIVPWGPGGGADQLARKAAPSLEKSLGVSLPVINVPGATGGTGMTKLLAGPADGHALAVYIADSHAAVATGGASWKMSDITPIARMMKVPSFLFVKADGPYKTWADFEKAAKANPGKLKVAIVGQGSVDDVTLAYLGSKGIKVQGVPFPNPGERYTSVLGGHVDALYEQAGDVRQYLTNGQMKPIIVFNEARMDAFKDVPSSKELGIEIYLPQFRGIVAKGGLAKDRVQKLADAFKAAYNTPEFAEFAKEQYMTPDSFQGADDFGKYLQSELDTMTKLMKEFGIRK